MNEFQRISTGIFAGFLLGILVMLTVAEPIPAVQAHQETAPDVAADIPQEAEHPAASGASIHDGDASPFPDGAAVEPQCDPVPAAPSIRDAIAEYKRSYGVKYFVYGTDDRTHLIRDHGWKSEQLVGLTLDELQYLHGATHTGKIHPRDFAVRPGGVAPAPPGADTKPRVRIISPATWDCPHCPGHRNQDWSGFDATFEKRDGLPKYPCTEWTDSRGVTRRLYGVRTPNQVRWSYQQTMGDE